HHIFARVWGDGISWVFAPAGGGKTALRIAVTQACWVGQETNRPFPIPYVPPFLAWGHARPSEEEHLLALIRSGTRALFLAMAHRPHWFFQLDASGRQEVANLFSWNLPGPLAAYLSLCRQSGHVAPLRETLDPTFILRDPPNEVTLQQWCDALEAAIDRQPAPSPPERWAQLLAVLRKLLSFPCVYILADGFDGAPETIDDPIVVADCLRPLLHPVEEWAQEKVFLKAFLPTETLPILTEQFPALLSADRTAVIQWTPDLLAEVVRRRVYVASGGDFGSLDAVASPALRDVETVLARAVLPLPREMLVLTRQVIEEHVRREGAEGLLKSEDIEAAIKAYSLTLSPVGNGRRKSEEFCTGERPIPLYIH
ncbi:MAG: hypothetical protein ACPLTQ_13155, partial [Anaerolineae bacterium]